MSELTSVFSVLTNFLKKSRVISASGCYICPIYKAIGGNEWQISSSRGVVAAQY
jgi:hypothetical protein